MLTKGIIKSISSLKDKKSRNDRGLFIVEGEKSVLELLESDFKISCLYATKDFIEKNKSDINKSKIKAERVEQGELEKLGLFEHNTSALAVAFQKKEKITKLEDGIVIVLDGIKDPGNLGTIIRTADWFGVKNIVASKGSVDFYNHKTISASMGSFTRVSVIYEDLETFLQNTNLPRIGATLEGQNVHSFNFPKSGILVIGSEANGISKEIEKKLTTKVTIPSLSKTESLNASIATAIILDNWTRTNDD